MPHDWEEKARDALRRREESLTHEEKILDALRLVREEIAADARYFRDKVFNLYGPCVLALLGLILWRVW